MKKNKKILQKKEGIKTKMENIIIEIAKKTIVTLILLTLLVLAIVTIEAIVNYLSDFINAKMILSSLIALIAILIIYVYKNEK